MNRFQQRQAARRKKSRKQPKPNRPLRRHSGIFIPRGHDVKYLQRMQSRGMKMSGIPWPMAQEIPDIFIPPTQVGNAGVLRGRNENSGMTTVMTTGGGRGRRGATGRFLSSVVCPLLARVAQTGFADIHPLKPIASSSPQQRGNIPHYVAAKPGGRKQKNRKREKNGQKKRRAEKTHACPCPTRRSPAK